MGLSAIGGIDAAAQRFRIRTQADPSQPSGAKVLWVCSSGGHLSELFKINEGMLAADDSVWVTCDSPQSRGMLGSRRALFVRYVAPRDLGGALRAAYQLVPVLRRERFDMCISTGAAVAAGILPMVAATGTPTYYIESVARTTAPSLTGRLMALAPRVQTYCQYQEWASPTWPYAGSLLDGWKASGSPIGSRPLRILVTLGTIRPYRFDRAVNAVLQLMRRGDEVVWQLGATSRPELPGEVHAEIEPSRLTELARRADVVVAHAGVGSILHLFENGVSPALVVRSDRFGEHVDNHQQALATATASRGLATVLDLNRPSREALLTAAGRVVASTTRSWVPGENAESGRGAA